ncbi:MAG: N-acetyl-gamma-glutamyl-phosphate reductase [Bacteroidetes bacterium]|nr:N-acetyl-gamma-glutamyl-phosphate reductase [Bacteroidota bacterium]
MDKVRVAIVGGSGYTGGELLRLLLSHPSIEVTQTTSERLAGRPVIIAHPNLRGRTDLRFSPLAALEPCDVLLLALPHGTAAKHFQSLSNLADRLIDLSADFRLHDPCAYEKWYGHPHPCPEVLRDFVYGIPELHRSDIAQSRYVATAGCNATASILALHPLYAAGAVQPGRIVVDVKVSSSEGGGTATLASHHPERAGCIRSYKPTGHRHQAEIRQELGLPPDEQVHFSATAVDLVRGLLVTAHVFPSKQLKELDLWRIYRQSYGKEPFIRLVKAHDGVHRYPEPKLLWGTNYCDIGFEADPDTGRIVILAAIDNLVKGSAGQAVQCLNIMFNFPETTGLDFPGLHPI